MSRMAQSSGVSSSALSSSACIASALGLARRALKILALCAIAALLAFWLAPNGSPPVGNCESLGRGGDYCRAASADEPAPVHKPAPARECQNVGRGGLICSAYK